jgi:hypothetical protein
MLKLKSIILLILLMNAGCWSGERETANRTNVPGQAATPEIPVFNADSAYYFVEKQVAFGPRVPNTQAHVQTADWLQATLRNFADTVYVQNARVRAHDGTILNIRNIIGSFQPEKTNRVLLCAHWDSRPWADHDPDPANHYKPIDGANDGASGVGVLLEIARILSLNNPRVGVDIILFDGEDYGKHRLSRERDNDSWALGSQHWSKNPHLPDYKARFGILLDMVGATGASFKHEGYSLMYAPNIIRKIWNIAAKQGFRQYFINAEGGYVIDDHYYINKNRNIPVVNIIDQRSNTSHGFYEHWHTVLDNMEAIDPQTLQAVGQTVTAVLFLE